MLYDLFVTLAYQGYAISAIVNIRTSAGDGSQIYHCRNYQPVQTDDEIFHSLEPLKAICAMIGTIYDG